jgi:primosomal protein N' (replication factor Y)
LTVVRVLPDEPAINKSFDYLVPDSVGDQVRVGDRVRIALQGRRVGGWIVATDVEPPAGVALRPIAKWSGRGPTPELVDLATWAAWRWAGRQASLLRTASPSRMVSALPLAPHRPTDRALSDAAGAVGPVRSVRPRPRAAPPAAGHRPLRRGARSRRARQHPRALPDDGAGTVDGRSPALGGPAGGAAPA